MEFKVTITEAKGLPDEPLFAQISLGDEHYRTDKKKSKWDESFIYKSFSYDNIFKIEVYNDDGFKNQKALIHCEFDPHHTKKNFKNLSWGQ